MKREQSGRSSVQTLLVDANPVPDSTVANSWRDSAGRSTYEAIVRTPLTEERGRAEGRRAKGGRARGRKFEGYPRPPMRRKGFIIGTAVVAASVAAGLVISGVPSRLLGPAGKTGPPTGIAHPAKITTWPSASAKTAKGTAPMLHYVLTGSVQPGSITGLPPARSVLLKVASAAEHRAPLPQPAGAKISFVVTNSWFMDTAVGHGTPSSVIFPEVDDTWFAPNGASRVLSRQGHPIVVVAGNKESLRSLESGKRVSSERSGAIPEHPLVGRLSLDPTVLKRELLHADPGGNPPSYQLFDIIRQLHEQIVSPRLDAAMWRVLAARPDVRYLGKVTDRAGRAGVAVAITLRSGERSVLIISPKTGQLLGAEDILLSGAPALHLTAYPAVLGYTIFLAEHWTKTMNGSGK
jgi:hypothetical protein